MRKGQKLTPEQRQRLKDLWARPERREMGRQNAQKGWNDPQGVASRLEKIRSPKARKRVSEQSSAQWADPDMAARMTEANRESWTPERRAEASARSKKAWTPRRRAEASRRTSERNRKRSPEEKAEMGRKSGANRAPEYRKAQGERIGEMNRRAWAALHTGATPTTKKSMPKSPGRPREDKIAQRVKELKATGKSWAVVTRIMNREIGETKTVSAYRSLLIRRSC